MTKKKILNLIFTLIISLSFGIVKVNAGQISQRYLWCDSLGLDDKTYNTRLSDGSSMSRQTRYIGTFTDNFTTQSQFGNVWFCVEPGIPLESGHKISDVNNGNISYDPPSRGGNWKWNINNPSDLERVLSCWYHNDYSKAATQTITWEIVTQERYSIDAKDILTNKNYQPYMYGGSVFGNKSGVTSLYEIISGSVKSSSGAEPNRKKLYQAYIEALSCAARFKVYPSNSYINTSLAQKNAVKMNSYNASTEQFSTTISNDLFNYYQFSNRTQKITDSGLNLSISNGKLTVTTSKEIMSNAPITIPLYYSYITKSGVDGKAHILGGRGAGEDYFNVQYLKKESTKPQALARAAVGKTVYISFYTGPKPTYQLKINKKDEAGNGLKDVKFYICSSNVVKSGGSCNKNNAMNTITTNESGVATLTGIKHIGQYIAVEAEAPFGYVADTTPANITVSEKNTTGSNSYATANKTFINKKMHLKMLKRTIDENGKVVTLSGDACQVPKCVNENNRDNGPIFTISKDGKKLCVKQTSNGKYVYDSLSETCASGTTDKIKTCNGAFDIEGVGAGTYEVTEIATACGMTLPSKPTQTVVVSPNVPTTTVTMTNGVTGLVFTKITEDGSTLDGGKFTLQKKENGIYKDLLLVHTGGAVYQYKQDVTEETENATYVLDTEQGLINVKNLPTGQYRMVERQAPIGYDLIKDKDSTATVTISDKNTDNKDFYEIRMVNKKTSLEGTSDDAEFVVTIKTGRNVINYPLIIGGIVILLVVAIVIRKKTKK